MDDLLEALVHARRESRIGWVTTYTTDFGDLKVTANEDGAYTIEDPSGVVDEADRLMCNAKSTETQAQEIKRAQILRGCM